MSVYVTPTWIPLVDGSIARFSDGRIQFLPNGSTGLPGPDFGLAGFAHIQGEVIQAGDLAIGHAALIGLHAAPLVPASLIIRSGGPLTITETGSGTFTGEVGIGPNVISLTSGIGQCTFNADAPGPIMAEYSWFGTELGTVFTLVGSGGEPLGQGTVTLPTGMPLTMSIQPVSGDLPSPTVISLTKIIDPDPSAQSLTLNDPNLDAETLALIMRQLEHCSELWQHEITVTGRNVPWLARGSLLSITDLHDENGDAFALPPAIIQQLTLDYDEPRSVTRNLKALAWTKPGLISPPGLPGTPAGDAQIYTLRGAWAPLTSYAEFDAVIVGQVYYIALRADLAAAWTYPATSGPTIPLSGDPVIGEGQWVPDGSIHSWFGVHQILTLTGAISGQTLLVRDRSSITHYLTYYPSTGVWTDTPSAPA